MEMLDVLGTILQIVEAQCSLNHRKDLIHSGLKPTNILVIMDAVFEVSAQEYFSLKVIDFGLAKTEDHSQIVTSHCTTVGTEIYCAPDKDVILEKTFPRRSDVRSLGKMLSLILNGKPPSELTDGQKVSGLPGRIKKDWKPLELLEDCPDYLKLCVDHIPSSEAL
ncbi:hypothetical protein M758_1G333100 [Ceratodon purpureus]|nr:hypothetical protein M758_1G333100 [Ceratodon purpureus]